MSGTSAGAVQSDFSGVMAEWYEATSEGGSVCRLTDCSIVASCGLRVVSSGLLLFFCLSVLGRFVVHVVSVVSPVDARVVVMCVVMVMVLAVTVVVVTVTSVMSGIHLMVCVMPGKYFCVCDLGVSVVSDWEGMLL